MAKRFWGIAAGVMLGIVAAAGTAGAMGDKIVVASKIDTEGALLGNMIVQVLEHAGLPVENKIQLGPTKIVRTAITSGEVDIYPEYTGNAGFFFSVNSDPAWKNAETAYQKAKSLDEANKIVWLQPAPANNTWDIAVRKDLADANKLRRWRTSANGSRAAARSSSPALPSSSRARPPCPPFRRPTASS